ncbi:MAG: hypothetical protein GXP29_04980 [Planctomycetes bacterium]|nr:hypothetical protein [Planctomycetota bacterium]
MYKTMRLAMAICCMGLLTGCSIKGNWKTVRIDPPDMAESFAFSSVNFGNDGTYSATVKYGGKSRSLTGKYEWSGFTLKIIPRNGERREYRGEMWWGKTLHLHHKSDGKPVTGVLERHAE